MIAQSQNGSLQNTSLRRHIPELAVEWLLQQPEALHRLIDGTLCFADISGFTALAERLARRGRAGGEELVETLSHIFSTMLDIAGSRGGELLKFGGDALLLFFRGPDHAQQAASSAVEMRRALRELSARPTSVGRLRMSMSVGLHSGPVDFFLVGKTHRELAVIGPAANSVIAAENAAVAGEIRVSSATAMALPESATLRRKDGQHLLRWRKPHMPGAATAKQPEIDTDKLESLFPLELGRHLAREIPDPEHRVACISFIKVSGADEILEQAGADALADALHRTVSHVQECLDLEGVTLLAFDVDQDGGKLFCSCGAPFSREDDEGAMLHALKRIFDAPLPLPLQAGVSRGHVFAAEVGSRRRSAFSAMGDTTNTAARICAKAPTGRIWAHPHVLDECLTLYRTQPSDPLKMKGKSEPLIVFEVGEEAGRRQREGLTSTRIFGRQEELEFLSEAVQAAKGGHGQVVALESESGLGKTCIVETILQDWDVTPVLSMRGEPYGADSPYRALRDPVRALLGIERDTTEVMQKALTDSVGRLSPTHLPLLGLLEPIVQVPVAPTPEFLAIDPEFRPPRAAEMIADLISGQPQEVKAIVVDDAHWLDDATISLLSRLADLCPGRSWLMIIARRPGTSRIPVQADDTLKLQPLSEDSMRKLVQHVTDAAPLRPHEIATVVQRSSGNPLFALEILKTIRELGSIEAVPESLEAMLSTQIDGLEPVARRVIRYASVLGRSFSRSMLEALLAADGITAFDDSFEGLDGFLKADGPERLRFRSGVVRDTTYEGLAFRLRTRLHLLAGETIERMTPNPESAADGLALHFSRGGSPDKAWRYALKAADRARVAYANSEAANLYRLATEAARRSDGIPAADRAEVYRHLGETLGLTGEFEAAMRAYTQALRLLRNDARARAETYLLRAIAKERSDAFSAALADLTRGVRCIENYDDPETQRIHARLQAFRATVLFSQDHPIRAIEAARRAAEEARIAQDSRALADALAVWGDANLITQGHDPEGHLQSALALFERLGDLRMQARVGADVGVAHAMKGEWEQASNSWYAAVDLFKQTGNEVAAASISLNLGEMLAKQRRIDEAKTVLEDSIRVLRAAGVDALVQVARFLTAQTHLHEGALAQAEQLAAEVAERFGDLKQRLQALQATLVRVEAIVLRGGDPASAMQTLDEAVTAAGQEAEFTASTVQRTRALVLSGMGRFDDAESAIEAGLKAAAQMQQPYEGALLELARAEIRERAGRAVDDTVLQRAREVLAGLGVRL